MMKPEVGGIIILTGPSGSGKSSLVKVLFEHFDDLYFSVSCTTRAPREGEVDGVHYHFISEADFLAGIEQGQFVEYAKVHDHYYGTTHKELEKSIQAGKILLLDIDVQGQSNVKKIYGDRVLSIFLTTPSKKDLEERLRNRGSDDECVIKRRLECASFEMAEMEKFDYFIINHQLQESQKKILAIVESFKSRVNRYNLKDFIKSWNES